MMHPRRNRSSAFRGRVPDVERPPEGHQYAVSTNIEAEKWDEFLQRTPGGYHGQSSLWAQVKAAGGWECQRTVLLEEDNIVAGAQMLVRSIGLWKLASIPGGPVFSSAEAGLRAMMLREILNMARRQGISYVLLHPYIEDPVLDESLAHAGFLPSTQELITRATIILDLSQTLADLFSQLRKRHRQHVRRAEREGLVIRECSEQDLPAFFELTQARGKRHGYTPDSFETLKAMWKSFGSRGLLRMAMVFYEQKPIAGLLSLAFGDTVFMKRGGWAGEHGLLGPNEYLHWDAIRWAHARGYRWVDLEGIDLEAARSILFGEPLSYPLERSPNYFKLGFGGKLILRSEAREIVFNPALRWAYQTLYPRLRHLSASRTLLGLIRKVK